MVQRRKLGGFKVSYFSKPFEFIVHISIFLDTGVQSKATKRLPEAPQNSIISKISKYQKSELINKYKK